MREALKEDLIKYLNSTSSSIVCENAIHVFFQRFGREREVDKIIEVEENHEEERLCDSG